MKIKQTLFAAAMAVTAITSAQEEKPANKFSLGGEFRPRTELFGNGFNYKYQAGGNTSGRKGTDPYVNTSVRAALNATYTTEAYTLYTSVQEVFTIGDRPQISAAGNGNLRIQEAWADIKLGEFSSLKIGRQPLSYDDQRILGGLGWAQQARTHDVAVFKYKKDGYSLDIGGGHNTDGDNIYDTAALFSYKNIGFVRANKKYDNLNLSVLALINDYQAGTANISTLKTAGIHADYKLNALSLSANAYIQDGERVGDVTVDGAYLASLDAKYKISDKTTLGLGYETISGTTDDSAAFFPLYGTNHKFNGYMDRFYVGNHAVGNGLNDAQASIATKVAGMGVSLTGHYFTEQSKTKNDLGTELDLVVAKKFNGYAIKAGYSQFFESDDFPNPAANADAKDTQNWAWVMLIIKPKFL